MERVKEPMWERLKRREELRKAEAATGGRKKYVSPLELFRMELEAEAAERETSVEPSGDKVPQEMSEQDGATSAVPTDNDENTKSNAESCPPSPDDCEAAAQLSCKSTRTYTEAHQSDHRPEGNSTDVFPRESWLKCMFPFKQCRKVMKSATRTLGVVDMSTTTKDTFFRNPLYKNKFKAAPTTMATVPTTSASRSRNKTHGNVEESSVSESSLSKTRMGRRKSVEKSDRSKCRVIAAAIPDEQQCRRKGSESAREQERIARFVDEADFDAASMGEPDYTLLVHIYRQPSRFPFGRMQGDSPSPVTKSKSYRAVGALKKALLGAQCYPEGLHRMTSSASPEPPSVGHRKSSDIHGLHRQDSCEEEQHVYVVSRVGRHSTPHSNNKNNNCRDRKKDPSRHPRGVPLSYSTNGRMDRPMAMNIEKSKASAGSRSARETDESPSDHGYTAFVPFQGFAAFAQHGGSTRAEQATFTRSLESQCSSVEGSRNSSLGTRESEQK